MKYIWLAMFILTIPAANWLIGNFGNTCIPNGPCLIPVGFGLSAPSGVLMVGLALVLRDVIHEIFGSKVAVGAIAVGAIVSAIVASPSLAIASAVAFALSELADLAVYSPLRKRSISLAVVASGFIGSFVDSAVFLLVAFGSLEYLVGQVAGKAWMTLAALPVIWIIQNRCRLGKHDWRVHESYGYGFTEKCERCAKITDRGNHWN